MPKCATCGKVLKNSLAMSIHVGRMHKTKGKKARQVAKQVAAASLDVSALAIDALIVLKRQVDHRLAGLAEKLTLAGVMGVAPARKPGRKPGRKAEAPVAKVAAAKKGIFSESATEMILGLLKGGKPISTTEIAAAWTKAGRKGKPSKTLSEMVATKKIKRQVLKGVRENNYALA